MQGMPISCSRWRSSGASSRRLLVGYVVSFLWAQRAEGIARKLMNDPAPQMH